MLFSALEYVSVEKRSFIGNFGMAIGVTIGGIYQPWLLHWLGDWKIFNMILYVQCALVFLTPWYVCTYSKGCISCKFCTSVLHYQLHHLSNPFIIAGFMKKIL